MILYNSKESVYKMPFGSLTEGQKCKISIFIPSECLTEKAELIFLREDGDREEKIFFLMKKESDDTPYEKYSCEFSLDVPALYFYFFRIKTKNEEFSLYKAGYDRTNMEAGELWQLSVIPKSFCVPEGYAGEVMYQIFPDRFNRSGVCDTKGKLEPFLMHGDLCDVPDYSENEDGEIRNCDFYGGNLLGIAEKLEYLDGLGVKVIYLNPIFKAYSNHRYDTADYKKIDELLGTEDDLAYLCKRAHEYGMKIILDGVFSHTGSNSVYFDKEGIFGGGAYHSSASPYRRWYDIDALTGKYTSWWGIKTLPCVNENEPSFRDFLIEDEDSVLAHWMRLGVDGFRLDVADELPDEFIMAFRKRMKGLKSDSFLIGEVWEDASNKISYGKRRRYFTDGELDSVMNYPFRNAIIDLVTGVDDGSGFQNTVMTLSENYPQCVLICLMNMLSTHDTVRILSELSPEARPEKKEERATYRMPKSALLRAKIRLRAAAFLQFILPGMPCIFYGDEIGTEGFEDPFCRSYFRWEDVWSNELLEYFISLSKMRNSLHALKYGDVRVRHVGKGSVMIERRYKGELLRACVNIGERFCTSSVGEVIFANRISAEEGRTVIDDCGFFIEKVNGERE